MKHPRPLHFVDLFAGCGGLSLGLENVGFTPVFVNELNVDAMNTYRRNRERTAPHLLQSGFHCHDIKELAGKRGALASLRDRISQNFGEVDLVVGGPPCQGFSGIGHRRSYSVDRELLPSNHLYKDMVEVISALQPKMFLFENVRGLLTARWTRKGAQGEIWADVQAAFNERLRKKYEIKHATVYAKEYGVPQNRPRLLMVGIQRDIVAGLDLDPDARAGGLLPEPSGNAPNLDEVIGDLVDSRYDTLHRRTTLEYPKEAVGALQKYFRRDPVTKALRRQGAAVTEHEYSFHADRIVEKFRYMIENHGEIPRRYRTKKFSLRLLPASWGPEGPTITATSMPDDYVHFEQPRTLSVREWARLQTFPDWYFFAGKRTTGGLRRAGNPREGLHERELPKYTQIGNAVPVMLAQAVGAHFLKLLRQ